MALTSSHQLNRWVAVSVLYLVDIEIGALGMVSSVIWVKVFHRFRIQAFHPYDADSFRSACLIRMSER